MTRLFSIARTAAVATLAIGAGALLTPAPAEAQGRHGYSGGGVRMGSVGLGRVGGYGAPRMAYGGGRMAYGPRVAGGYRTAGYRPGVRPPGWGPRPPGWRPRPPYYGGGWYGGGWYGGNPYWPAVAGVGLGLGLASAAYYANDGYYVNDAGYGANCWLERRTVRTNYGRRVVNVQVCPAY